MDSSNLAVATACFPNLTVREAMEQAQQLGFTATGFLGASGGRHSGGELPGFFWDELDGTARRELIAARREFDRGVIHAPFQDLPLLSVNPYIEREAVRQVEGAIRAAEALDLEVVTVHVPGPSRVAEDEFMERIVTTLRGLGDAAETLGVRIGIENLAYPCEPAEHTRLLEAVDHPAVGATIDVGHILHWCRRDGMVSANNPDDVSRFNHRLLTLIDTLGPRIVNVHLHDVRAADLRDHRAVGRGIIDFASVIDKLERLEYQGLLELELEEADSVQAIYDSRQHLLPLVSN